jgi:hypothetical protein
MDATKFQWPSGKRVAVSFSFDDARPTQLDPGIATLDKHGLKGTFYVSFVPFEKRLDDWKCAAANGHEIGNHTVSHPCSGNFRFSRNNALEEFTLDRMERELIEASDRIEKHVGKRPRTFAYPCYERTVGRGENVKSYVPLIAKHFVVGRAGKSEWCFYPPTGDLAQIYAHDADGATFDQLKAAIERGVDETGWVCFSGHEVGAAAPMTTGTDVLDALCRYCKDPANGVWFDTVANIGQYVKDARARV